MLLRLQTADLGGLLCVCPSSFIWVSSLKLRDALPKSCMGVTRKPVLAMIVCRTGSFCAWASRALYGTSVSGGERGGAVSPMTCHSICICPYCTVNTHPFSSFVLIASSGHCGQTACPKGDNGAFIAQGICLCPSLLFATSASLAGVRLFICSLPKDKKLVELMKTQVCCIIKIANHFSSLLFFRVKRPPDPQDIRNPQYQQVQFYAILKSQRNKMSLKIPQSSVSINLQSAPLLKVDFMSA